MSPLEVKFQNPEELFVSSVFSQLVTVRRNGKTIYIGGQNAINSEGKLVGKDDLSQQTKQVLKNIKTALASENATFDDVIKFNIYLVDGCDPAVGLKAFQEEIGELKNPPLITVLKVAGLALPQYLIEIEALAIVDDSEV